MIHHRDIDAGKLRHAISEGLICYGGNIRLKTYGKLSCTSGKRMKKENRVFFVDEKEAIENGYRPCGHCLKKEYKKWRMTTGN